MGSPAHEPGRFDSEGPQHAVTLKAFALSKYPVTSAEYLAFLNATAIGPSPAIRCLDWAGGKLHRGQAATPTDVEPPRWPAVCLDWTDAEAYIVWINARARAARPALGNRILIVCPAKRNGNMPPVPAPIRRAGGARRSAAAMPTAMAAAANGRKQSAGPVDAFELNPFDLSGMLGNAWEWTADCWHPSYVGAPADGRAWTDNFCLRHAIRGGAWNNVPIFVRSAARVAAAQDGADQDYDYSTLTGFRVARDLP